MAERLPEGVHRGRAERGRGHRRRGARRSRRGGRRAHGRRPLGRPPADLGRAARAAGRPTHTQRGRRGHVLTTEELDPAGYGRIVRAADGSVERIVETKDPSRRARERAGDPRDQHRHLRVRRPPTLWAALERVAPSRAASATSPGVFPILRADGDRVASHLTADVRSAMGVNDRADLMEAERAGPAARSWKPTRAPGSPSWRPSPFASRRASTIGEDTTIWPGVTLRGADDGRRRTARSVPAPRSPTPRWATGVTAPALVPGRRHGRRRRHDRPVRLPAPRRPHRRRARRSARSWR